MYSCIATYKTLMVWLHNMHIQIKKLNQKIKTWKLPLESERTKNNCIVAGAQKYNADILVTTSNYPKCHFEWISQSLNIKRGCINVICFTSIKCPVKFERFFVDTLKSRQHCYLLSKKDEQPLLISFSRHSCWVCALKYKQIVKQISNSS